MITFRKQQGKKAILLKIKTKKKDDVSHLGL